MTKSQLIPMRIAKFIDSKLEEKGSRFLPTNIRMSKIIVMVRFCKIHIYISALFVSASHSSHYHHTTYNPRSQPNPTKLEVVA